MDTVLYYTVAYFAMALFFVGMFMRLDQRLSPENQQPGLAILCALIWPASLLILLGAILVPNRD